MDKVILLLALDWLEKNGAIVFQNILLSVADFMVQNWLLKRTEESDEIKILEELQIQDTENYRLYLRLYCELAML